MRFGGSAQATRTTLVRPSTPRHTVVQMSADEVGRSAPGFDPAAALARLASGPPRGAARARPRGTGPAGAHRRVARVSLATAVAIAFPRSPTVTALSAWTLAQLSGGRFVLGSGRRSKAISSGAMACAGRRRAHGCARYVRRCARSGIAGRTAQARFPGRALQAQPDGAAVRAAADRAPADPGRAGGGQPVYVPGGRRGGRRHPRPPDRDAALHRRNHAAGGAQGCGEGRARSRRASRWR